MTPLREGVDYALREGERDDVEFILATWLRSHRYSGYGARLVPSKVYFQHHHPLAVSILQRARVLLAVTKEDARTILGYLVYEPHAVHFVYVKKPFRRFGLARRLLQDVPASAAFYTHLNETDGARALVRKLSRLQFNPYATEMKP